MSSPKTFIPPLNLKIPIFLFILSTFTLVNGSFHDKYIFADLPPLNHPSGSPRPHAITLNKEDLLIAVDTTNAPPLRPISTFSFDDNFLYANTRRPGGEPRKVRRVYGFLKAVRTNPDDVGNRIDFTTLQHKSDQCPSLKIFITPALRIVRLSACNLESNAYELHVGELVPDRCIQINLYIKN